MVTLSRYGIGLWLLLILAAQACNRAPRREAAPSEIEKTHITLGLATPTATYLPVYVAQDEKLFAQEGLDVTAESFRGGSDVIKALVSGSVDIGVVSLAELTAGIDAGQPLRAFYAGFNVPEFDWYAVPTIKTLADAKGKRFGITEYGATTDFLTRYALAANGLDPKSVKIVPSGDSRTRLAAMQAGQLDVNAFSVPEKFIAAERGYNLILRQKDLAGDYPFHLLVASDAFIAGNKGTLRAFLRAHVRALRLAKKDRVLAAQALVEHLHIDPKYVERTYDDFIGYLYEDGRLPSEQGLNLFFDMGIQGGRFKERWPREKYWNSSYVDTYEQWKPEIPPDRL